MGWNSWDAYGLTINEADYRANTTVLAGIRQSGWQYSVIDEGWYMQDPFAGSVETRKYLWNENGILVPDPARFPSAANNAGFKPLADWVHAQGLKFGIHIVRGIPRQVVEQNLPIAGLQLPRHRCRRQAVAMSVGPRQLGRRRQRRRPGLLRFHAQALRGLGPRLHQG